MHVPASSRSQLLLLAICIVLALFALPHRTRDQQLRRRVVSQLAADPVAAGLPLKITAASGVATVTGGIADREQQAHVLATVAHTAGVVDVIDDLTISDAVITQHVRDAFHSVPDLAQIPVTVTTTDGEVTLRSDQTNAAQRRQMVQIAGAIDGVGHVVDAMK